MIIFFYDFSYWYFQSPNGCVGYNVNSNCTVTMGFCRELKQETGCQDSSLCVKTTNGNGKHLTVSHSVGQFGLSPFKVSNEGKYNTNSYMFFLELLYVGCLALLLTKFS